MFKFKKSLNDFVGIDIGATAVKIVCVSLKNETIHLENLLVVPVPLRIQSQNAAETASFMSQLFAQINEIANKEAALSVPLSLCAEERIGIEFDASDAQIEGLVKSKINNISPYPPNETRYDYFLTRDGAERTLNISATKKEALEINADTVASSGVKLVAATGGGFAFEKAIPLLFNQEQLNQNIALFNIGYEETAVYLLDAGKLVYSGEANFGVADTVHAIASSYNISQDEALARLIQNNPDDLILQETHIANLFADLHQMLVRETKVFMMNSPDFNVDKLYLSGDFATIPRLIEFLNNQNRFHVEPFNPFANMAVATRINPDDLNSHSYSMLDALIAAMSIQPGGLNLMPWREIQVAARKKQFITGAMMSALAGALLMGGIWGYQSNELKKQQAATNIIKTAITEDREKITALGNIEAKKKLVAERLSVISSLQDKRFELVKALNYFVMNFPDKAYLTEMSKQGDVFIIHGRAKNSDMVVQLIRSLRFYPYFNDVTVTQWVGDSANPDGKLAPSEVKSDGWGSFIITFTISSTPHDAITNNEVYLPAQSITNPSVNGNTLGQVQNSAVTGASPLTGLTTNQMTLASAAGAAASVLTNKEPIKPVTNTSTKTDTSVKTETVTH